MQPFRRVAIVEEFFDIIYNVHVGLGGRSGRHAGQKRTYRTITETYAFLPRDAVTKFLAGCQMCNKGTSNGDETHSRHWPLTEDDAYTDSSSGVENNGAAPSEMLTSHSVRKSEIGENITLENQDEHNLDDTARELNKLIEHKDMLNYYQLLRVMYERSQASTAPQHGPDDAESTIDLTISKPSETQPYANSININIDHGPSPTTTTNVPGSRYCTSSRGPLSDDNPISRAPQTPHTPSLVNIADSSALGDNITINSAGMSINVSTSPSELKISCKTTPPKKRLSRSFNGSQERNNNDHHKTPSDWHMCLDRKTKEIMKCEKLVSVCSVFLCVAITIHLQFNPKEL